MWKRIRLLLAVFLIGCQMCGTSLVSAETNTGQGQDQAQALLEKGLTVHELDREISRLQAKEKDISGQIQAAEQSLVKLSDGIQAQSDKVKRLLQATYTGERTPLWMMIFSSKSWKDALFVFEQLTLITARDHDTLDQYKTAHQEKAKLSASLESSKLELSLTRTRFETQRSQMLALQDEVARKLELLPQKDEIAKQMNELNNNWETKGLPLFKQYFAALASTMQQLPELVAQNPNSLSIKGFTYTFQIKDSELNAFIHNRNPSLKQLNFTFGDGTLTAAGKQNDTSITLIGAYELELKPKNAIRFHIREITYNGFKLPAPTMEALEKTSDLSFYPSKLASFLQATNLKMKDHVMAVTLKMSL